ncbi:hypothetical protein pEaSNUABM9_00159 [Erwinia phage pEa_SNUABM_9]|nr:hypothetical protein pEaSNUABM9_00159 [Erwinia phage pEa_SNUABM_9]
MFTREIIKTIALALNDRFYQTNLNALAALSQLLQRKRNGSNHITDYEFSAMMHTQIERVFPVPFLQIVVDGRNRTMTMDGHMFVLPEPQPEQGRALFLSGYNTNPWNVVILDDEGNYHIVASGDRYAIPHGEISIPFDLDTASRRPGALRHDNVLISGGTVTWIINSWKGAGKILSNIDSGPIPMEFQRIMNQDSSPLELNTADSLKSTYIDQDLSESLGLEQQPYPYNVNDIIEALVLANKLNEDLRGRIPTNQTTEADKETLAAALKIQGTIQFNDLLTEVMALSPKKRTQKALNEIIPRHLENILAVLNAKK